MLTYWRCWKEANVRFGPSAYLLVLTDLFCIIEKKEAGLPKPRSWTATNRDSWAWWLLIMNYALCIMNRPESYSSVGQSATLIMWRSAVQVCLGLLLYFRIHDSWFIIHNYDYSWILNFSLRCFSIKKAYPHYELCILNYEWWIISPGGLAQLARAPALQAGGQRFESVILHEGHGDASCIIGCPNVLWHIDTSKTVK